MTERLIQFRENGRRVVRGLTRNLAADRFELDLNEGETLNTVLDFTPLVLAGETLTAAHETTGMSVTLTTASPKVTVAMSALSSNSNADSKITVTRSGGQVHVVRLRARPTATNESANHYYRRYA